MVLFIIFIVLMIMLWNRRKLQKVREKKKEDEETDGYVKPELEAVVPGDGGREQDEINIGELEGDGLMRLEMEGDAHHCDRVPVEMLTLVGTGS